jgi:hypothetical protein
MLLRIPSASLQEIVTLCVPGASPSGGDQFQDPDAPTLALADIGFSDSTVIVSSVPLGPLPKNSGFVEFTISPSSILSRVIVLEEGVVVFNPERSNFDFWEILSGASIVDVGKPSSLPGGRLLKSWTCPRIIGGTGLDDAR